jgi:hypothetical protein
VSEPVFPHELPIEPDLPPKEALEAAQSDDLQPTVDLGAKQLRRQALDSLFARVLNNQLTRGRALLSWEPDKLDERHLQAVLLRASGMKQQEIAKQMGWTDGWTSIVLNHPDAQYVLTRIVSYASDNVIDMQARIQALAPEALDTMVEVMRSTQDEKLRKETGFDILKMAGYGVRKEVPSTQVQINNFGGVPAESLGNLASALRESREIVPVQYSLPAALPEQGSGSSVSPAPSVVRSQNAGEPPASDSSDSEDRRVA